MIKTHPIAAASACCGAPVAFVKPSYAKRAPPIAPKKANTQTNRDMERDRVGELRYMRHRDHVQYFNSQDSTKQTGLVMQLEALAKQEEPSAAELHEATDFIDALVEAPSYLRVKGEMADRVKATRERLAEVGNPDFKGLDELRRAYDFLYNTAEQAVHQVAQSAGVSTLARDSSFVSGKPVPEVVTR
jgi:hypothetical protein